MPVVIHRKGIRGTKKNRTGLFYFLEGDVFEILYPITLQFSNKKRVAPNGATLFLYPVSIYNYFVTTLRSTGILASTASPLIIF